MSRVNRGLHKSMNASSSFACKRLLLMGTQGKVVMT